MSECKKTCGNCAGLIRSVLSKDRCDMTNKPIENYSSTCKAWVPNRDTEVVMQKDELKALRNERDELQAQVAVLKSENDEMFGQCIKLIQELNKEKDLCYEHFFRWFALDKNISNVLRGFIDTENSEVRELVEKIKMAQGEKDEDFERVLNIIIELLQDAVSETENGERLSKGFCSAAKEALAEWRRDKCSS